MPWQHPTTLPFSRIAIAASVPSESGVFGIAAGGQYLLLSSAWNLKARLLELISTVTDSQPLTLTFELCPESDRQKRLDALSRELPMKDAQESLAAEHNPSGLRFWY